MSNYEKIKNSVDVRCHKYNLKLVLIASAVCMAIISTVIGVFLIMNPQARDMRYWGVTSVFVIMFLIFDAVEVYVIYSQIKKLTENSERYVFFETVLSASRETPFGAVFEISVNDSAGRRDTVTTAQTFGFYRKPYFEDYNGKKAEIAYDCTGGRVLVVRLI